MEITSAYYVPLFADLLLRLLPFEEEEVWVSAGFPRLRLLLLVLVACTAVLLLLLLLLLLELLWPVLLLLLLLLMEAVPVEVEVAVPAILWTAVMKDPVSIEFSWKIEGVALKSSSGTFFFA